MWIEATKNGKYKACERYTDPLTGKLKKVSVTIEKDNRQTRKAAQEELAERIRQAMGKSPNADVTLGQLRDAYLADKKMSVRESTYTCLESGTKALLSIIPKDTVVSTMTSAFISSRIRETETTPSTINYRITSMKKLLSWGYTNDYVQDRSLADKLRTVKDDKKGRIEDKYLEPEELTALVDNMTITRWKLLTKFLALTGLRIGEAIALTMDDVDKEYIHITKTYLINQYKVGDSPKTTDSVRDVYIQTELVPVLSEIRAFRLKDALKHGYKSNLLFPWRDGGYIEHESYKVYLARHAEKVTDKRITPHALRHTHVSLLAAQGVPIDVISRRLGHHDSGITREIYFHVTQKLREKDNETIRTAKIL